jgi:hypothetical protein
MTIDKEKFNETLKSHGHKVIVKHTDKKIHCDCFEQENQNRCFKCFGTGWKYNWYITKTRRTKNGAGSLANDRLEKIKAFIFSANSYKYYFKTEDKLANEDFIIEFKDNDINLFYIRNTDIKTGTEGVNVYQEVYANRVIINKEIVETSLLDIAGQG